MADNADTLSIKLTMEAKEATESVDKLTKALRSLASALKQVQERSGLSGLNESVKKATESVNTAMKGVDGGAKSAEKGTKAVATAAKEATKATKELKQVAEKVQVKADTSDLKQAVNDMATARQKFAKPVEAKAVEARKALPENLHETASAAAQQRQTWTDTMGDLPRAMGEIAEEIEPYEVSMAKYAENIRELKGEVAKATAETAPKSLKGNPPGWENMSAEEKRDAWINMGASGARTMSSTAFEDRQTRRRAEYKENWAQYLAENQTTESSLDSTSESTNKATSAFSELRTAATAALEAISGKAKSASVAMQSSANSASDLPRKIAPLKSTTGVFEGLGTKIRNLPWRMAVMGSNTFHGALRKLGHGAKSAGGFMKGFLSGFTGTLFKAPLGAMKSMANLMTFGQLGKGAKEGQSAVEGLTGAVGTSLKGFMKYALGFRTLFYLVRALRGAIAEGFTNLASVNAETNESLSMLKSRLTQVKNGLASAFAPVLNYVAPILNKLIGYLMDGINAVAQFFATLTGKTSWQKAVYKAQDFSAAASGAGDAASGANEKAKELQKTLLSFDKINKLNDNDSSSGSGGSGGGGGGGGGASGAGMFSTETVSTGISDFANMVKDAWEKADFTEVGNVIGKKLKNALDNIPWGDIKEKVGKVGKSLGTLITGFVETEGLAESIGTTIAEALNTVMTGGNEFLKGVNWQSLGSFVTTSIQTMFRKFDWKLAGNTFGNLGTAVFNLAAGAIRGIDWSSVPKDIGTAISKFLKGVNWGEYFKSIGNLAGSLLKAAWDLGKALAEIVGDVGAKIKKYFVDKIDAAGYEKDASLGEKGKAIIKGIFKGITDFLSNVGTWAYNNIVKPFLEGVTEAMGIGADKVPNTGKDLIEGVFNGIIDWFKGIGTWIKTNILDKFIGGFRDEADMHSPAKATFITDLGKNFIEGVFQGILDWMANIKTWVSDHILKPFSDALSNPGETISNGVKGVKEWFSEHFGGDGSGTTNNMSGTATVTFDAIENPSFSDAIKKRTDAVTPKDSTTTMKANTGIKSWKDAVSNFFKMKAGATSNVSMTATDKGGFKKAMEQFSKLDKKSSKNKRKFSVTAKVGKHVGTAVDAIKTAVKGAGSHTTTLTVKMKSDIDANLKNDIKAYTTFQRSRKTPTDYENMMKRLQGAKGGSFYGGRHHKFSQFASGGVPDHGTVFVAGEAGAEAVGHINGRSEVLNQSQMASVMYTAVVRGMTQALANTQGTNPTFVISPDPAGIFRVVQTQANRYTATTGKPAFNI